MWDSDCLFAVITESHLNSNVLDAEIHIAGYTTFRKDRYIRKQGGVVIYVKDNLANNTDILYEYSNGVVECMAIHIKTINCVVIGLYRPPDCKSNFFKCVINDIDKKLCELPGKTPDIHLMGDFNFPFLKWEYHSEINIPTIKSGSTHDEQDQAKCVLSFAEKHLLSQVICKPTREKNVLDLCFTNNVDAYYQVNVHETALSDHNIIMMDTNYVQDEPRHSSAESEKLSGFRALNFYSEESDWRGLEKELNSINWEEVLVGLGVNDTLKYIHNRVLAVCNKYVPQTKKLSPRKNKIPKYNRYLMRRRSRINKRLTQVNKDSTKLKLTQEKYDIEQKLREAHKQNRRYQEKKATEAIQKNSKYFFSYARKYSNTPSTIGPLIDSAGNVETDPKTISNMFRKQYESVFSPPLQEKKVTNPSEFFNTSTGLTDIEFTEDDLINAMMELKNDAAPGPDGFPALILKKCSTPLARPLAILWRKSLDNESVPDMLKEAIVSPIFKGGNLSKGVAKNYRPIALTSHIIKVFEKVVRKAIVNYLEDKKSMNINQHGFRSGRSCLSQLLAHYDYVLSELEKGNNVDVIYLDFAKAFDKVDHGVLLHKLRDIGINGKLGSWIHSFLTNRYQCVAVNNVKSSKSSVISGVPQGSVLGPLLFLVHIGDIDTGTNSAFISSFADDTRSAAGISNHTDQINLQKDLDVIYKWSAANNMQFNNDKFERLAYGRIENLRTYDYISSDNSKIPTAREVKDLGIIMSDDATFTSHISTITGRATKFAGWILRTFMSRDTKVMLLLWKSLVLSRLENSCPLWSPTSVGDTQSIESVQRSFTAKIDGMKDLNYWERLESLKLYSLQRRRERYDIIYVWKILDGKVPNISNCSRHIVTAMESDRRLGRLCILPKHQNTATARVKTLLHNSFTTRAVRLFNILPKELRNTAGCSVDSFKNLLDKILASVPDQPPLPGYYLEAESNSLLHQLPLMRRKTFEMKTLSGL